ncbi:craniofacial development protein 2-like [Palaemon carinicauda]|uniref:craniofacial development protein 2-like n=1 Tax=Palaemon carinicauda TaxID=392227 RepID=UPI0035B63946
MIVLAGDSNGNVDRETDVYGPAMGRQSLNKHSNDNGTRLVSFAVTNNLIIGGTLFPHKDIHKHTWKSPGSRTFNQIDHVLFSRKHRRSLKDVRSLRGADCDTDPYLVRASIKAKLCAGKSRKVEKKNKYDVAKLKEEAVKDNFQIKFTNRFQMLELLDNKADAENVNTKWQAIEETVKETAVD